jgi:hypothetical protein
LLLRPAFFKAGTPYTEGTGLICRVPSPGLIRYTLAFSARGTCVSSRYGFTNYILNLFSRALRINLIHLKMVDPLRFGQVLTMTVLPQLNTLEQTDESARSTRMRQDLNKCL